MTVLKSVMALVIALAPVIVGAPTPAGAAVSPDAQFVTSVTGTIAAPGDSLNMTFGTSGVTGTFTVSTLTGVASVVPVASPLQGTNVTTYVEPDPPAASARVVHSIGARGNITGTVTLNKALPQVLLHVANLDESTLTVTGTSTTGAPIQLVPAIRNDELEIAGNILNSTPNTALNTGCEVNGTLANPNGGCGSVYITAASGLIKSFILNNVIAGNGDGWQWTLSFATPCTSPTVYMNVNGQLYRGAMTDGAPIAFASVGTPNVYNAMGYNPADGYLYARTGTGIARVDPTNGGVVPRGDTAPPLPGGEIAGAFDALGNYDITNPASTTLSKINVDTMTRTAVALSAASGVADFTLGRTGGFLYGATSTGIVQVNPATGLVRTFPLPAGMAGATAMGGAFTFPNGDVAFVQNNPLLIYRVSISDPASATPTFALVGTQALAFGPAASLDATSCALPPPNAICELPPPASLPGYNKIVLAGPGSYVGTAGNDLIIGSAGDDHIASLGGNDIIFGLGGNDDISAGTGDDIICGGPGNDRIAGEDGFDVLDGGTGNDDISGGMKDDLLFGGPGDDRFAGDLGTDNCQGGGSTSESGDVIATPTCELVP